ncbi:acyltransferase [Marinobacter sp.]|uniref:acyltransferase n=1 Tax=Marinobacter sp. TaxID=50741 RepID=UPI003A8F5B23
MYTSRLYVVNTIFSLLPSSRCFSLKNMLLRWAGAKVGDNVRIASSARFYLSGELEIGCGTWIGHQVLMVGGDAKIVIGESVDIAPRVTIVTGTHELWQEDGKAAGKGYSLPVSIENGVWIGAGATVLGGVVVGSSSMIAAGAIVNKTVPSFCLFGGNPAKLIRRQSALS